MLQKLNVYLTEWEDFHVTRDHANIVWNEDLVYGDWTGGPQGDGTRMSTMDVAVPEVGSLYQQSAMITKLFSDALLVLINISPHSIPVCAAEWNVVSSCGALQGGLPTGPRGRGLQLPGCRAQEQM